MCQTKAVLVRGSLSLLFPFCFCLRQTRRLSSDHVLSTQSRTSCQDDICPKSYHGDNLIGQQIKNQLNLEATKGTLTNQPTEHTQHPCYLPMLDIDDRGWTIVCTTKATDMYFLQN